MKLFASNTSEDLWFGKNDGVVSRYNGESFRMQKNNKLSLIIGAFFSGLLIGIIIFGAAANVWGFIILLPLFLIYIPFKKPKRYEALKKELEKRNLQ